MTINEIKSKIAQEQNIMVTSLMFTRQFQEDKVTPTEWVSSWDNQNRIRISMHDNVLALVQANPNKADLAIKHELVEATDTRLAYHRYVIITPQNVVATF